MKKPLLFVFFLAFLGNIYSQLFLFPYVECGDGLSLFNPVYMGKFYGRIVYPAYYYYDNMPVHPPVYYWFLSLLYTAGLPVFYVIKLPLFLALVLFVISVVCSKFSLPEKITAALAVQIALHYAGAYITFRPDIVLSLLFLSGLICLHNGTQSFVSKRWLIIGSLLIGLSSSLHYFGIAGVGALFFFSYKIWKRENFITQLKTQLHIFLPATIIIGFYLAVVILPNIPAIAQEIVAGSINNKQSAVAAHYQLYKERFDSTPLFYILKVMPVFGWVILGAVFMKPTRWIFAAAIPFILFVFFVPAGKGGGYCIVEFTLFFWMLSLAALYAVQYLLRRVPKKISGVIIVTLLLFASGFVFMQYHIDRNRSEVRADAKANGCEMFTARACGKKILGNNAKVGARLNVWLNSGAAHYYQISRHTINMIPVTNQTVQSAFEKFDAIAEYGQGCEISYRPDKYSLPQWYADGSLKLKGFYLSNNYQAVPYNKDNDACYLLFSAKPCNGVKGFMTYNNEVISEFNEGSAVSGNYFLSVILPDSVFSQQCFDSVFQMYTRFVFPDINGSGYKNLVWGITKISTREILIKKYSVGYLIKDLVPLLKKEVSKNDLLNYKDQPVKFYSGLKEIEAGEDYYR